MVWRLYSRFIHSLSFVRLCCRPTSQSDSQLPSMSQCYIIKATTRSVWCIYHIHIHSHIHIRISIGLLNIRTPLRWNDTSSCGIAKTQHQNFKSQREQMPQTHAHTHRQNAVFGHSYFTWNIHTMTKMHTLTTWIYSFKLIPFKKNKQTNHLKFGQISLTIEI